MQWPWCVNSAENQKLVVELATKNGLPAIYASVNMWNAAAKCLTRKTSRQMAETHHA